MRHERIYFHLKGYFETWKIPPARALSSQDLICQFRFICVTLVQDPTCQVLKLSEKYRTWKSIWCSNTKHITAKRGVRKTIFFYCICSTNSLKFELYRILSSKIDIWRDTKLTESILRGNFNWILVYYSTVKCSKQHTKSFVLILYLTVLRVVICLLAVCLLTGSFSSRLCRFQRLGERKEWVPIKEQIHRDYDAYFEVINNKL